MRTLLTRGITVRTVLSRLVSLPLAVGTRRCPSFVVRVVASSHRRIVSSHVTSQATHVAKPLLANSGLGVHSRVRHVWRRVLQWPVTVYLGRKVQRDVDNSALCANSGMGSHPPGVPTQGTHIPWSTLCTTLGTPSGPPLGPPLAIGLSVICAHISGISGR